MTSIVDRLPAGLFIRQQLANLNRLVVLITTAGAAVAIADLLALVVEKISRMVHRRSLLPITTGLILLLITGTARAQASEVLRNPGEPGMQPAASIAVAILCGIASIACNRRAATLAVIDRATPGR